MVEWMKDAGDAVEVGDIITLVETDKVSENRKFSNIAISLLSFNFFRSQSISKLISQGSSKNVSLLCKTTITFYCMNILKNYLLIL